MNKHQVTIKISEMAHDELRKRREIDGVPITVQIDKFLGIKRKDKRRKT